MEEKDELQTKVSIRDRVSAAENKGYLICFFFGILMSLLYAYTSYKNLAEREGFVATAWKMFFVKTILIALVAVVIGGIYFVIFISR